MFDRVPSASASAPRASQRGLSLIEMMIALVLSALLMLGLIEIFSSTRAAFTSSEALARVQENSRFAMDFLRRDLRMAGHYGCLNEADLLGRIPGQVRRSGDPFFNHIVGENVDLTTAPLAVRADMPIQVFDYTGTGPGGNFALTAAPAAAGGANQWTPSLPAGMVVFGAGAGGAIAGSDVVVMRYFDEGGIPIQFPGLQNTTGRIELGAGSALVVNNAMYGLANCARASLFQVTNVGIGFAISQGGLNQPDLTNPGTYWDGIETYYPGGVSTMYRYRFVVYYVGFGTGGEPALFRRALAETPGGAGTALNLPAPLEVVENVEMMQVLLGTTTAPDAMGNRSDSVTAYVSATDLLGGVAAGNQIAMRDALRRIASLRISVLLRSPTSGAGGGPAARVVGDVNVAVPADDRLRHVYDTTIGLRNRSRQKS